VKLGGQSAWDGNTALKMAGEKRILKVFPPGNDLYLCSNALE
jgi:hypothetical protein